MSAQEEPLSYQARVQGQPVSVNRMYRRARQGHLYLSDAASAWELAILAHVRAQMNWTALRADWERTGRPQIGVTISFSGVRGDLDNYAKCTLDGLKHALGIDDRHFSPVTLRLIEKTRPLTTFADIELTLPASADDAVDPWLPAPSGSLHALDLIDTDVRMRLLPPTTHVQVWPAPDYGCVVVMFPPSPLAPLTAHDTEWGTFLPLAQARELRDALDAVLTPERSAG